MDVVAALRSIGARVELDQPTDTRLDTVLDVAAGDVRSRFAVEAKTRAPYPNELGRLTSRRNALARVGKPLLVAPFVNESLAAKLSDAGWSWADAEGNFDLRAPGLVLRQRRTSSPPRRTSSKLPQGTGSLAAIRALIGFGHGETEERGATALAAQAGISQPRASQVLHQLHALDLVERTPDGRWSPRREALLDRFLAEYRGPGGSEQHLYALDPLTDLAGRLARVASATRFVASADVGPDLLIGWRRPSVLIVYTDGDVNPSALALVESQSRHDANVILRHPRDLSVFPKPDLVAQVGGVDIPLADPTQQIWDLQELGGADRLEAAGLLREWLLTRP